ncbi:MAG: hypothetical protein AB1801_24920 [Chloroflexota bacterium]
MEKEKVRCWKLEIKTGSSTEQLYITYPEGSYGHKLISCLNCGEIFAVNLTKELYVGPSLEDKLRDVQCPICDVILFDHYSEYPEKYLGSDGVIHKHIRENEIPSDDTSIVKEFLEIYSE